MFETYVGIFLPVIYLALFMIGISGLRLLVIYAKFRGSNYRNISGNNFVKTLLNRGSYGEFLTFGMLEKMKGNHKLLTNIYLPKQDGATTEIDLLMIHETGIYIFESKNYSGWIFGDEKNKMWTQSLKGGKKHKFYNPIWQNKGHIGALDKFLKGEYTKYLYSYIVFSERCELKKVNLNSQNINVMKRNQLIQMIRKDIKTKQEVLSVAQMNDIYKNLNKQTLVSDAVKREHIETIQLRYGK